MRGAVLIGVALIVVGVAMLVYGHFSYTTREKVLEVGPIKATAERTKTVRMPPILGWTLVGGGVCVLVFGAKGRKA